MKESESKINLFGDGRKIVCIRNLSDYAPEITESYTQDEFPKIGRVYTVSICELSSRASESRGYDLTLLQFDTTPGFKFKSQWFAPSDVANNVLMAMGIDANSPSFPDKLKIIYEKGWLKPENRKIRNYTRKAFSLGSRKT